MKDAQEFAGQGQGDGHFWLMEVQIERLRGLRVPVLVRDP